MLKSSLATAAVLAASLIVPADKAQAGVDPFIGEVMLVGFNFCPRGWAEANGALLPISSNTALFSLYGTIYGGDGRTTFALPDLQGRVAMGNGNGPGLPTAVQGRRLGTPTTVQTAATMAPHTHTATTTASTTVHTVGEEATLSEPSGGYLAHTDAPIYSPNQPDETMAAGAVTTGVTTTIHSAGLGQPQENHQPSLVMKYCVALVGTFPSRN